ncbi:MAG TPA: hypothetical protein VFQ25_06765 [Ktedonobacterales bacterium]|nr:hypothetical protein [Ktedonobacterales bacterium]
MEGEAQRIVIYPDRARLIRYAALYGVLAPLMAFGGAIFLSAAFPPYSRAHPVVTILGATFGVIVGAVGLLGSVLVAALFVLTLYRLMARKPSIEVSEEGIFDGCSLIGGGMGLLRWSEIEAIIPAVYRRGMAFVVLYPRDAPTVLARRGAPARLCLRVLNVTLPGAISLPEWLLSMPVGEVCERICAAYPMTLEANGIGVPGGLPGAV